MLKDKLSKQKVVPRPGDWTDVLAPKVINQYLGKHIAIIHKRVVASGGSYDGVLEKAQQLYPDETPYLAYIPTPDEAADEETAAISSHIGQYAGTHVAIVHRNVVASAPSRERVERDAQMLYPGLTPYFAYIPASDDVETSSMASIVSDIVAHIPDNPMPVFDDTSESAAA
jgi:hypothetical protein